MSSLLVIAACAKTPVHLMLPPSTNASTNRATLVWKTRGCLLRPNHQSILPSLPSAAASFVRQVPQHTYNEPMNRSFGRQVPQHWRVFTVETLACESRKVQYGCVTCAPDGDGPRRPPSPLHPAGLAMLDEPSVYETPYWRIQSKCFKGNENVHFSCALNSSQTES